MAFFKHSVLAVSVVLGLAVGAGCSSGDDDGGNADESNITSTTCQVFNNQTGKPITAEELKNLNDPIAKKLLAGQGCPKDYSSALKKMKDTDNKSCKDASGGKQVDGLGSYLVSETSDLVSKSQASKDGYRTVITKTCENRKNDEMLFSGFASIDDTSETSLEMIGKDATTGVYNFYEVIDKGQWVFYGNSFDFVGNGYTCKDSGFCVSNNSKKASSPSKKSCASCHISGGLIMKELDSPWLHWTTSHTNGSEEVVKKHAAKLGNQQNGEDLELQVVRPSFDGYNEKRAEFLATKGVAELVRPLFCTMDINLNSGTGDTNLFLDAEITQGSFTFDDKTYDTLKKEVKQRINGLPAKNDDTASPFTYPTRGQIDTSYSAILQKRKLLDKEFVADVLNVDFTRPIFSGARCGLVNVIQGKTQAIDGKLAAWAGEKDAKKRENLAGDIAKAIPDLFKDALKGASKPAEKKLLANLSDGKANAAAHEKEANDFIAKCEDRLTKGDAASKKAATKDIMIYASHVRRVMRKDVVGFNGQDLLEGGGEDDKMVTDDIPDTNKAFDPTDCKLTLAPNDVN